MDLRHLTDKQLLKDTEFLVKNERAMSTKILHHLKEIDRRKLYCDLKYSSLYEYCVKVLKLTEASAQRRIQAARLLADLPEIEARIESGALSITNLANASSFFKKQEIHSEAERKGVLLQLENLSTRDCEKKLFQITGEEIPAREIEKRISDKKVQVSMVLTDQTLQKMEKLRGLLGRNLSYEELLNHMVDAAITKVEKEKFKIAAVVPPAPEAEGRYITAGTKGQVYRRDQQCTNCGSVFNLNYDHQIPFAFGGETSIENLRLLCFQCNQRARIRAKL